MNNSDFSGFTLVPPGAALRDIVECYWLAQTPETEAQRFRFLPTGRCDIVFSRDGSMLDDRGLIRMVEPGVYVVGPCEQYTRLESHPKSLLFGIRLCPSVASGLLDLDVADLTGRSARIECFSAGIRDLEMLGDRHAATDVARLITRVERILLKVAAHRLRPDVTVARAIYEIERSRGNCSIAGLARQVSLGERQLSRRFAIQTGLTPKSFAQLIRFGQVRDALLQGACREDLAALALGAGYADQAHMTRDFRRFAGVSPNTHRRHGKVGFFQYDPALTAQPAA